MNYIFALRFKQCNHKKVRLLYLSLSYFKNTFLKMVQAWLVCVLLEFVNKRLKQVFKFLTFVKYAIITLRQKCLHSQFFWSIFSLIRNEYGEMWNISRYSAQMRRNTDQENSEHGQFWRRVICVSTELNKKVKR